MSIKKTKRNSSVWTEVGLIPCSYYHEPTFVIYISEVILSCKIKLQFISCIEYLICFFSNAYTVFRKVHFMDWMYVYKSMIKS